ncbi:alpha-(1,3)-fucosyltransferase 10-like, partial [Ptychodera flava]|uniref:alpha-(1,3)-fucosyltransferase 10-like n=1 Tax=Ptychodera flava TaxID=63121 RepID=UPI00396A64BB
DHVNNNNQEVAELIYFVCRFGTVHCVSHLHSNQKWCFCSRSSTYTTYGCNQPKETGLHHLCFVCRTFFVLQILSSITVEDVVFGGQLDGIEVDEFWIEETVDYGGQLVRGDTLDGHELLSVDATKLDVKVPIILWWTGFTGERGKVKTCGEDKCFFTVDRHFQHHPRTKVFMYYGTDVRSLDLPLPRKPHHEWALLHEESPKNNYKLTQPECLTLFNHTSTFKRQSDFPITTQYLEKLSDLSSTEYLVPTQEKSKGDLAPVVFVQSDCDPPSDRDSYVRELMKHIRVDSYGACLHNRDLPSELVDPLTMDNRKFHEILARYKFHISFENAICDDYITEKFWRAIKIGSVPIYRGSPSIKDWLPTENAAIIADDFASPEELAKFLKYLDENDEEYEKHLDFKKTGITNERLLAEMNSRKWGVNDYSEKNFIDTFECDVCNRVNENERAIKENRKPQTHIAKAEHYNCPRPTYYNPENPNTNIDLYMQLYDQGKYEARALRYFIDSGKNFTRAEYRDLAQKMMVQDRL